ncbi:uncharacterized protein LOC116164752 isoform X1 [Photinus pyralis]|uniref:uncharacterized protein LOC116164752 isoform X1 n=1 Tax=Photinus pyralis TaxID=7054 RepID=UPI0012673176|nr:uncharacterized protein LOC116164752 isoform X1 [Photinus pyralis]
MGNFAPTVMLFVFNYFNVLKILSSKNCEASLFGFQPIKVILWIYQIYVLLNNVLNKHQFIPYIIVEVMLATKFLEKIFGKRYLALVVIPCAILRNIFTVPSGKFTSLLDKQSLPFVPFWILTIEMICKIVKKVCFKLLGTTNNCSEIETCATLVKDSEINHRKDGNHLVHLKKSCARLSTTCSQRRPICVTFKVGRNRPALLPRRKNLGRLSKSIKPPPEYDEDWRDVTSLFNSTVNSNKRRVVKDFNPWKKLRLELELHRLTLQLRRQRLEMSRLMLCT